MLLPGLVEEAGNIIGVLAGTGAFLLPVVVTEVRLGAGDGTRHGDGGGFLIVVDQGIDQRRLPGCRRTVELQRLDQFLLIGFGPGAVVFERAKQLFLPGGRGSAVASDGWIGGCCGVCAAFDCSLAALLGFLTDYNQPPNIFASPDRRAGTRRKIGLQGLTIRNLGRPCPVSLAVFYYFFVRPSPEEPEKITLLFSDFFQ